MATTASRESHTACPVAHEADLRLDDSLLDIFVGRRASFLQLLPYGVWLYEGRNSYRDNAFESFQAARPLPWHQDMERPQRGQGPGLLVGGHCVFFRRTVNVGARFFGGRPSLAELRKLNVPGVPSNAAASPSALSLLDVWTCGEASTSRSEAKRRRGQPSVDATAIYGLSVSLRACEKKSWRRLEVMHHQAQRPSVWSKLPRCVGEELLGVDGKVAMSMLYALPRHARICARRREITAFQ